MQVILGIYRLIKFPVVYMLFLHGSRRLNKWMKKIKRDPDMEEKYPFERRYKYAYKNSVRLLKTFGVNIVIEGIDNLPKGSSWITPNHVSALDGFIMLMTLGSKRMVGAVVKKELKAGKFSGYFTSTDTVYLDRRKPREFIPTLNLAASLAKHEQRGMTIFPEGTRTKDPDCLPGNFKGGVYKFAQSFFLPVIPVTIAGAEVLEEHKFSLKLKTVSVKFHKPIKPMNLINLNSQHLADKIQSTITDELKVWESKLSPEDREIRIKALAKRNKRLDKDKLLKETNLPKWTKKHLGPLEKLESKDNKKLRKYDGKVDKLTKQEDKKEKKLTKSEKS